MVQLAACDMTSVVGPIWCVERERPVALVGERADGDRLFERPSNTQMEPTRPTGCAIMALRRAAHLQR